VGRTRICRRLGATLLAAVIGSSLLTPAAGAPGVTKRRIKIGMHAPLTGAVPVPSQSAQQGAEVFWRWLRLQDQPIDGRHVEVVLKNDQSNPSTAVGVCKEMVEQDDVFMLLGTLQSSLPYQSQACARYAESVGVPYIAIGTSRDLESQLSRYFAITATYVRQGNLLADMIVSDHRGRARQVGVVHSDEPATGEGYRAFVRAMQRRDASIDYDRAVSRNAGIGEARLIVEEMRVAGIDIVFFMHTPTFFINVLRQADTQEFRPLWTGIGAGLGGNDALVDVACGGGNSIDGARFLTFLPAFRDRNRFGPRHDRAMSQIYSDPGDYITWQGWSTSKVIKKMLDRAGRHLTRRRFVRSTERARFRSAILPQVRFEPRDHFGGRGVHVLRASCQDRRWHTVRAFVRDF
jgi:branched-chain amino acid transport system substrate-binding protein